jgi:hypothetical protein
LLAFFLSFFHRRDVLTGVSFTATLANNGVR